MLQIPWHAHLFCGAAAAGSRLKLAKVSRSSPALRAALRHAASTAQHVHHCVPGPRRCRLTLDCSVRHGIHARKPGDVASGGVCMKTDHPRRGGSGTRALLCMQHAHNASSWAMAARTLHKSLAEGCWSTVIAAQGCSSGRLRWDVRVNSTRTGAVAFGLAPSAIPIVDVAPGSPVLFMPWMWMPDHQSTFTDNVRSGGFGEPIASGDTLTFTLDTDARTLAVAKCVSLMMHAALSLLTAFMRCGGRNGRDMGLAFTELSSSTGALHPALALNHLLDCVTISGLPDSFVHGRSIALADKPASPLGQCTGRAGPAAAVALSAVGALAC